MAYVSTAIYSLFWITADTSRVGIPTDAGFPVVDALHQRIAEAWTIMDAQVTPGLYLLGSEPTVLDLYVTVVSGFGPWRKRFYAAAPRMTNVVRRVDAHPRLQKIWSERFPFEGDWENYS